MLEVCLLPPSQHVLKNYNIPIFLSFSLSVHHRRKYKFYDTRRRSYRSCIGLSLQTRIKLSIGGHWGRTFLFLEPVSPFHRQFHSRERKILRKNLLTNVNYWSKTARNRFEFDKIDTKS